MSDWVVLVLAVIAAFMLLCFVSMVLDHRRKMIGLKGLKGLKDVVPPSPPRRKRRKGGNDE